MAIAPCATGSRTALEITHGLARAVGTVQNVTTAFEQFWLPKPLLLGSAQRLKRWGFCRNDPRNLEPVRSAGPPFPSEDLQMCTYPTGGPMDLPPWTLQPPVVCGAQCWPPLLATGLRQLQTTRSEKRSTTILPSCVLDKAYSSSLLVVEACGGGWGPTAVATFRKLGALHASRLGMSASDGAEQLFQALSVALQRENARAVLRRLAESFDSVPSLAEP